MLEELFEVQPIAAVHIHQGCLDYIYKVYTAQLSEHSTCS